MFVQTHFQRARHQAAIGGGGSTHNHHHQQPTNNHSSVSHQHHQNQHQHKASSDHSNHTNHGRVHSAHLNKQDQRASSTPPPPPPLKHKSNGKRAAAGQCVRHSADAAARCSATTIKSVQKIKHETRAHQAPITSDDLKNSQRHHHTLSVSSHNHHQQQQQQHIERSVSSATANNLAVPVSDISAQTLRARTSQRHCGLRRSSEFEEGPEIERFTDCGLDGAGMLRLPTTTTDDDQQSGAGSHLTINEISAATAAAESRTLTTSLRLRASSVSRLTLRPTSEISRPLDVRTTTVGCQTDFVERQYEFIKKVRRGVCGKGRHAGSTSKKQRLFRWSSTTNKKKDRLSKSRCAIRRHLGRASALKNHHLVEKVLSEFFVPFIVAGHWRQLKSKNSPVLVYSRDEEQVKIHTRDFIYFQHYLDRLITSVKQTVQCLALLLLDFIQRNWLTTKSHFLAVIADIRNTFIAESSILESAINISASTTTTRDDKMRVYGNRRTASLQQASAHSFDGGQVPVQHQHQLSGPSAVHQQQQQQQQLHYHQANVVWPSHNDQNTPVIHRQHMGHTSSAGATHVHQHNHASLASYYGPHAYDLSLAQARETFLNNFDAAAATARPSTSAQLQQMNNQQPEVPRAGYFVVPSTTTSTSGAQHPYYGHVNYGHAHAVAQPAVESIGHTWRCDMRHTVDGGYPRRTHWTGVNSMRPMGASFDQHQLDLRQQQLNSQTGGYGMPPRQRMTSISSPTLSEYDNIDPFWGVQAGSTRTLVAPKSAHRYDHHIQHLEQNQAHQHYRDMATTSRPPPPPPRTLGYNTSHSLSMTHTGYGRHGHQRASPDPFVANSMTINQQNLVANRKLSSIMGSDSELYASSRRVGGQPAEKLYHIAQRRDKNVFNLETSPSTSSSSPSSRSSSQAAKTWTAFSEYSSGKQQQRPSTGHSSATSNKTSRKSGQVAVAAAVADRRRLTRQASSTSAASQAREPGSARPHKLAHQGRSLQVDALQARAAATVAGAAAASKTRVIGVDGGVATRGQSKSDPETRAAVNHAKARAAAKMLAGRATKIAASSGAESDTVKAAAATVATLRKGHTPLLVCGKSKSVNHHSGPMGVLGRAVSLAGAKRRLGFKQKCGLSSLSVHRSEEIMPQLEQERLERQQRRLQQQQQQQHQQQAQPSRTANERAAARRAIRMQQSSTTTGTSNSLNSVCSFNTADRHAPTEASPDGTSRWLTQFGLDPPTPKVCFVDGLGSGQIASRQALVSPYLGDIQVSLSDRRGMLEVEIIRVRQLRPKPNAPRMPSPFVKVYLMRDKKCAAKFKTSQARETLDPLYQQLFIFRDDYSNCVLQIIVWGDYGKRDDRKSLMGIVQINLNKLDMSNVVVSWYKLFNISSMVAATASAPCVVNSSKTLRQTLSSSKLHGEWATTVSQGTVFEEIKDKGGADKDDDKSRELPKLEKLKLTE